MIRRQGADIIRGSTVPLPLITQCRSTAMMLRTIGHCSLTVLVTWPLTEIRTVLHGSHGDALSFR